MKFEWDEKKNQTNISKHGFDFSDANQVFSLPIAVEIDERYDYNESRLIAIGMLQGRVVVIVYTEPDRRTVRIISMRKALTHERKRYEQYLKNRLG
ncbi:MAG: BrnT family toxin [Cyanobacteria bacterium J06650_10]